MSHRVWKLAEGDIAEGVEIAASRYADMDSYSATAWARKCFDAPHVHLLRTDNTVSCVVYEARFWRPRDLVARVVFFAAREGTSAWEQIAALREQIANAERRRCSEFELGAVTGVDFSPFAARLGMIPAGGNFLKGLR